MTAESDYADRFGGIGRLFGAATLPRLHAARVAVVGVGGVGSWAVEALARSGVGALTLVDCDSVCVTNVNRQLPALDGAFGRPKVEVLAERTRLISPECRVVPVHGTFDAGSAERLLAERFDWVVDAIDRLGDKCSLLAACVERGQPVLTSGGAGGRRDSTRVHMADLGEAQGDQLLRLVRKRLRRDYGFAHGKGNLYGIPCVFSDEPPVYLQPDGTCTPETVPGTRAGAGVAGIRGTAAFVTGAFGLAAAGEVVRRIVEGRGRG